MLAENFHEQLEASIARAPFHPAYKKTPAGLRNALEEELVRIRGLPKDNRSPTHEFAHDFARYFLARKEAVPSYWHCIAALASIYGVNSRGFADAVRGLQYLKNDLAWNETPLFLGEPRRNSAAINGDLKKTLAALRKARSPLTLKQVMDKAGVSFGKAIESVRVLEITPAVERVRKNDEYAWIFKGKKDVKRLDLPQITPNQIIEKNTNLAKGIAGDFWKENKADLRDRKISFADILSEANSMLTEAGYAHYPPSGLSDTTFTTFMVKRALKYLANSTRMNLSLDRILAAEQVLGVYSQGEPSITHHIIMDWRTEPPKHLVQAINEELDKLRLAPGYKHNNEIERNIEIIKSIYGLGDIGPLSNVEAADHFGVSVVRIVQLKRYLLSKLRENTRLQDLHWQQHERLDAAGFPFYYRKPFKVESLKDNHG